MTVLTRTEMTEKYGSLPMGMPKDTLYRWTICRAHADVTWRTTDGGDTWTKGDIIWADERNRRDMEALDQQQIQRELK
jgi:hypothetical protein